MYKKISIIFIGFTAMASQIVYLREFFATFYGNELSIGFVMANWLIAGSIASLALGKAADRIKSKIAAFISCQLAVSILLVLNIFAIRSVKAFLGLEPGEAVSVLGMAASSFVIIAPVCALLAFMFVLACRMYQEARSAAANIAAVYALEAAGSLLSGLAVGLILIKLMNSMNIIAIISFLNVAMGLLLALSFKKARFRKFFIAASLAIFLTMFLMRLSGGWGALNRYSLEKQWRGYQLAASANSVYGNTAVIKRPGEVSFFYNGLHLGTVPDKQAQEEAVHFAMLEHPNPKNVLLVGGAAAGLINEVIKYPVKKIDYVELDPLVIKMAQLYLPPEYQKPLGDRRLFIKNIDARLFIRTTKQRYDCVIMNLGDPLTAQVNRYYTFEFFEQLKDILNEGAVVSFGLSCSESYINRPLKDFLSSIYATLRAVFRDVKVMPGDTAYFLASDTEGALTYDYKILVERMKERGVSAEYMRDYYLSSRLSKEKIGYVEGSIAQARQAEINYDFKPAAYYYGTIFQMSRFRDSLFGRMLNKASQKRLWLMIFVVCAAIFLFAKIRRKNIFLAAIFLAGFSQMAFQIIILLVFQIIYGYVFYKMGIILASFMAGLGLASWLSVTLMRGVKKDLEVFILLEAAICVYSLALPLFFKQDIAQAWFIILPAIAGLIEGAQFPLANKILLQDKKAAASVAGLIYGVDLLGACLGAFLTEILLIPVLGLAKACFAAAAMNFVVLASLLML